jgi:hypothetical protein
MASMVRICIIGLSLAAVAGLPLGGWANTQGGATPETVSWESEMRLPLSRQGFDKLKAMGWFTKAKEREDLYLEIFGQGRFLLAAQGSPVKARFLVDASKTRWQVSVVTGRTSVVADGLTAGVKETRKARVTVDDVPGATAALQSARSFITEARAGAVDGAKALALAEQLSTLPVLADMARDAQAPWPEGLVLPAGWAKKERLEGALDVAGQEVEVLLARDLRLDAVGQIVEEFEVEAELPGAWSPQAQAAFQEVLERFAAAGLDSDDVPVEDSRDFAFLEEVYKRIL